MKVKLRIEKRSHGGSIRTEKIHSADDIEIDCNFIQQQDLEGSEKPERDLSSRTTTTPLTSLTIDVSDMSASSVHMRHISERHSTLMHTRASRSTHHHRIPARAIHHLRSR